jgi:ABC-type multidrug transport system fused ATPase/permease subunit
VSSILIVLGAVVNRTLCFASVGVLTNRLAEDSSIINKAFGGSIARELQAFFTLVIGLALGLSSSWKIALVVLATFPLNIFASVIQMQALKGQQ